MQEQDQYSGGLIGSELQSELRILAQALQRHVSSGRDFIFCSPNQARTAMIELSQCSDNQENIKSPASLRAALYGQSDIAAHFEAFRLTNATTSLDIIETSLVCSEQIRLGLLLSLYRALIERIGAATRIVRKCSSLLSFSVLEPGNRLENWNKLNDLAQVVSSVLYGTKKNWSEIAKNDLKHGSSSTDKYIHQPGARNLESTSVMNYINDLEKKFEGARRVYEILCEFAHPNVGDLFSSTSKFKIQEDRFGLIFYKRKIKLQDRKPLEHPDIFTITKKIEKFLILLTRLHVENHEVLSKYSEISLSVTQQFFRNAISKSPNSFRRDDLCPCLAGKLLYQCCGRKINS
jgi:hypothetical protein